MLTKILLSYLLAINLAGFYAMRIDKRRAIKHQRRIPEKRLFLFALLGGSVGSILAMIIYHHKTKHVSFTFGMPSILLIQILIIAAGFYFFHN